MTQPPDEADRPLSEHERAVLLGMERSLGAVRPARPDRRPALRKAGGTLGRAVLVVLALLGLAVLLGPGGFSLGVIALCVSLFGVTLFDLLRSSSST